MAKIVIPSLFEISRYLNTPAGAQLRDCLSYLSYFITVVVNCLKNGTTFVDNFECLQKTIQLYTGTLTPIAVGSKDQIVQIIIQSVLDEQYYVIVSSGWQYVNGVPNFVINVTDINGNVPASNYLLEISLLVFFG